MRANEWDIIVSSDNKKVDIDWKGLKKSKDLIFLFVRRTFVAQYKQTILGPIWAIIQPFFTTIVYSVFFGNIAGLGPLGIPNFIFYLSGTILWTLFSSCLTHTADTFIGNSAILGKVYFPRLVMPISTAISQFIAFFIQYGFMLLFLVYYLVIGSNVRVSWYILLSPLLLIQTALLGMGFGIIISALTTKYRDLKMVVGFGVSLWSYCSPVAYDMFSRSALMPGSEFYCLYMLNPMTSIINAFRYAYLGTGQIDWLYYVVSWIITFVITTIGVIMFSKVEKTFMDTV